MDKTTGDMGDHREIMLSAENRVDIIIVLRDRYSAQCASV